MRDSFVNLLFVRLFGFYICLALGSCNSEDQKKERPVIGSESNYYDGKGVGPFTTFEFSVKIDPSIVSAGQSVFNAKCLSCHEVNDVRKIGPGLYGITKRRRPEWILNQILNPMEMTQKDSLSKELLSIYMAQMTDMELTKEEAVSILEYFRSNDQ